MFALSMHPLPLLLRLAPAASFGIDFLESSNIYENNNSTVHLFRPFGAVTHLTNLALKFAPKTLLITPELYKLLLATIDRNIKYPYQQQKIVTVKSKEICRNSST